MIDPDDERTTVSRRNDPAGRQVAAPAPDDHDAPDDRTLLSRRSAAEADAPDDRTLLSRRSAVEADPLDDTVLSARSVVPSDSEIPTQAVTQSAPAGPRRTAHPPAPEPQDARTVMRRGSAPAPLAPEPAPEAPAPSGRLAAPPASGAAAYRARSVPPVTAVRAEPVRRAPQDHIDTAAADATRRRRRRRRTIAVVAAASVVLVIASVTLVVLLTTG